MIAFDPGELSTFCGAGPAIDYYQSSSVLNVADLPCPPQNVMEANWYKPAPGEPYIPRLVFPTKLQALDPLWATCKGDFFTAYDPPRTLVPVSAMTPTTTADPPSTSGGTHGIDWSSPTPAPVSTPKLHQPEETTTPLLDPGIGTGFLDPKRPVDGSSHSGGTAGSPNIVQPVTIDPESGASPGRGAHQSDPIGRTPIITNIAGAAATLLPNVIAIGNVILSQGGSATTIAGTVISLGPTAVVVGFNTIPLPFSQQAMTAIAGTSMQFLPNAVMIAGKILAPDTPPTTISGMVLSVNPSALMIAHTSLPLPQSQQIITNVAGQKATLLQHAVAIADHTMMPGGTGFTLSGLVMTVGKSSLLVYAQAIPFTHIPNPVSSTMSGPEDTRISTKTVSISTASASKSILDATMLMPGGDGGTIDGSTVSVSSNGRLIVDGHTLSSSSAGMVSDGTRILTASEGNMVVDGQTLQPTTRISSALNGNTVVTSQTLQIDTPIPTTSNDNLLLDSQTSSPGPIRPSTPNPPTSPASAADPVIDQTTTKPTTLLDRPTPTSTPFNQGSTSRHQSGGMLINETPTSVAHNGKPTLNAPGSLSPSTGVSADLGALIIGAFGGSPPTVSSPIVSSSSPIAFASTLSYKSAAAPTNEIPTSMASDANSLLNTLGTNPSFTNPTTTSPTRSNSDLGALIIGAFEGSPPTVSPSAVSSLTTVASEGTLSHGSAAVPTNEIPTSMESNANSLLNTPDTSPTSAGPTTTATEPSSDLGALMNGAFGGSSTVSSPTVSSSSTVAFKGTLSHESAAVPTNEIPTSTASNSTSILTGSGTGLAPRTSISPTPTSANPTTSSPPASSSDLGALIIGAFGDGSSVSSTIGGGPTVPSTTGGGPTVSSTTGGRPTGSSPVIDSSSTVASKSAAARVISNVAIMKLLAVTILIIFHLR